MSNVTRVVDGWLDAAYVGGDYPRETFTDAFPRFTKGAVDEAGRDVMLMTNADLGQRIDGVVPKIRRLTVDLLAVRGVAQAATARVRLVFVTQGGVERRVTVAGRLRLVRQTRVWRVFGYDITKADVPAPGARRRRPDERAPAPTRAAPALAHPRAGPARRGAAATAAPPRPR